MSGLCCAVFAGVLLCAVSSSLADEEIPAPDIADAAYGTDARQTLDVWLPKGMDGQAPFPVVLFIHGGGWQNGDKSDVFNKEKFLQPLLDEGIAVVSINYRFLRTHPFPASMQDAARALQFLRSRADEWNLDKTRIGLAGKSAGGCSALWLAFSDDLADTRSADSVARESTRVSCVYVVKAQSTLDPEQMKDWTGNDLVFQHHMIKAAFGYPETTKDPDGVLARTYSPSAQLSAGDPPVLFNAGGKEIPAETTDHAIHHPGFATGLKKIADAAGVPFVRAKSYQDYIGFFRDHLKRGGHTR
jgi:acetyl esterase/lipase